MPNWLKYTLGIVGTIILAIGGGYTGGALNSPEVELTDDLKADIVSNIDLEDLRGPAGPQGPSGRDGRDGSDGKDGKDGVNGKDADININALADAVADELEDRADDVTITFSGHDGNYEYMFEIDDEDTYEWRIKHFGAGDFDVSLEDEDGNVTTFIDTTGHVSWTDTQTLDDGVYTVHISADGNWTLELIQK